MLSFSFDELTSQVAEMEQLKETIAKAESAKLTAERKQKEAEDNLNSKLYEFEIFATKAKNREKELLECLQDREKDDQSDLLKEKDEEIRTLKDKIEADGEKLQVVSQSLEEFQKVHQELAEKLKNFEQEVKQVLLEPKTVRNFLQNLKVLFALNVDCSLDADDLMCDFTFNSTHNETG